MKITLTVAVIFAICIACCSSAHFYNNAKQILDSSQGRAPEGSRAPGHPRGHAIGRDTHRFSINSLQDYSRDRNGPNKSGFKSRSDQDRVVGLALRHRSCQAKME